MLMLYLKLQVSDGAMEILWFDKVEVTSFQTVYIWICIAALFLHSGVVCILCWSYLVLRLSLNAKICGDALFSSLNSNHQQML
jgi:hypothetical protein